MNAAEALIEVSLRAGLDVCFANPGTTEMALVGALSKHPKMRAVLALFEGVASGAADGYARMAGKPAATLLHLGPGLANATANLHNARRARSPVVNWVGDHTTWIAPCDPPLASDISSIARGSSQWVRSCRRAREMPADAAAAIWAALGPPAGVATLILPDDLQRAQIDGPIDFDALLSSGGPHRAPEPDAAALREAAARLKSARVPLVLLGGPASDARGLRLGAALARATGAGLLLEAFPRRLRAEPGLPHPAKIAYLPQLARRQLARYDCIALFGTEEPACFFGYEGEEPLLGSPTAEVLEPAPAGSDLHQGLEILVELVGAGPAEEGKGAPGPPELPRGALNPDGVSAAVAALLPEEAIVVDEGITSTLSLHGRLEGAAPHDLLACKGGAIGFAMPVATGAALAAPGRRVVTLVGDGSAAYTLQALWTQAREGLDVSTIVFANHKYAILQLELLRSGGRLEGAGRSLTDLGGPALDYTCLARGFGVPARRAEDAEALLAALRESLATPGPMLIEAVI